MDRTHTHTYTHTLQLEHNNILMFYALTQVLHALALATGLTLLVIFPLEDVFFAGIGGAAIVEATIVLSYEIIMIILVFVNKVNHQLRLLVVSIIMIHQSLGLCIQQKINTVEPLNKGHGWDSIKFTCFVLCRQLKVVLF